jgi:hypothetical protein
MKERESKELHRTAEGLIHTFTNRMDCYAFQSDNGSYYSVKESLTAGHVMRHLSGELTLGVYILGMDRKAKFAVIDADDDEGFQRLVNIHNTLPLSSYMESSRRGGHLWFFFEKPVEGKIAKNFGLEIAKRFRVEAEVFPKQAQSEGPGSCIRLPFGVHKKTGERYPFIGLGNWREQLDALLHPQKIPLEEVRKYQYQEPKKQTFRLPMEEQGEIGNLPLWEKVKSRIMVRELVEQYVDLNAKGIGKCPFHDDVNPSFSVNEKENYWNCFSGCGGGSIIDFWMKLNNLDFKEAVEDLAERLGVK